MESKEQNLLNPLSDIVFMGTWCQAPNFRTYCAKLIIGGNPGFARWKF